MPAGSPITAPVNPNALNDAAHQCNGTECASDLIAGVLSDIRALQQEIAALATLCDGASGGGHETSGAGMRSERKLYKPYKGPALDTFS